jgi:hypothetical protein
MIRELEMFLSVRPANGRPSAVGVDISMTELRMLETVPELVAWLAAEGRMM